MSRCELAFLLSRNSATRAHRGSKLSQHWRRHLPAHAGVSDALADRELGTIGEILATLDQETFQHHADDAALTRCHLLGDRRADDGLTAEILVAIAVAGVDHHPRRQTTGVERCQ